MNRPEPAPTAISDRLGMKLLIAAVSIAFIWILLPFYGTILWASIIGLLFAPMFHRLVPRMKGRRTPAALLTLLLVLVIVILPLALITTSLTRQAASVVGRIHSGELQPTIIFQTLFASMPGWVATLLDQFGMNDFGDLQRRITETLAQGSQLIAKQALSIGQNTFDFVVSLFMTLYLAFFLIRDGDRAYRTVRRAIPLAPQYKQELLAQFTTAIRATVKGNLFVAAVQGALGGLAFWFLDLSAPLLWAVLMAFVSLLPAIGAALIWLPVALYFIIIGSLWQGIALMIWGALVIGLVDNLLRPVLVGKDTRMPDYVVLMTTVGGIAVFGINGFVIGPAIAAMFFAVWQIQVRTRANENE